MKHIALIEEKGNTLPRFLVQGYLKPEEIGEAIEALIAVMDRLEGDPDLEDATDAEDDFALSPRACEYAGRSHRGPGCEIGDPGGGNVTDERHDAYTEDGV